MTAPNRSEPDCCAPVHLSDEHWRQHDARLRAARAAVEAERPKACPACGGADPIPTFLADGEWECIDSRCYATFSGRPDA